MGLTGLGFLGHSRLERDAPALDAMRRIAVTYPRYGYRCVRILLRREGHSMGPQRAYRLWRNAGFQLPRRRPRRRVSTSRPRPLPAVSRNQAWFRSRTEARVLIEAWRCHYNHVRPHSSLL